jgi:hypothetical protein
MREGENQGMRAAVITGIFAILAALITGICAIANTVLEKSGPDSSSSINQSVVTPPPLPVDICPQVGGMFWMQFPNQWYGPFVGFAGEGDYFLAWEGMGGFYVWDPTYGEFSHPDPYAQMQRNSWLRLPNSPFNVCVDSQMGNVFGQYAP